MTKTCAFCLDEAEGNYDIHRDGFGVGPEVPLCNACGSGRKPSTWAIWERIAQPNVGGFAHRRVSKKEFAELQSRQLSGVADAQ